VTAIVRDPQEVSAPKRASSAGGWGSIWLIYLYSVLASASISKLVPIAAELEHHLGASPQGLGFAISLLSLSSIFAATIGGAIIDRIGARPAMIITSLIVVACNVMSFFAQSMAMLYVARLIEGLEFIGIVAAAPALIMAITSGRRQTQAMALWSTYTPTGVSLGLLLAAPFAGTPLWRWTFVCHGILFAGAACLGGLLPDIPRALQPGTGSRAGPPLASRAGTASARSRLADLLHLYREPRPLRLAVANGILISIGLGTSTVVPLYFAQAHKISVATASSMLAFANLAMILGGLGAGFLLARKVRASLLYSALTIGGMIAGFLVYAPWVNLPVATAALLLWLLTTGGGTAIMYALLPHVVRDPSRAAATSGLVVQVMAVTSFVTPAIYLTLQAKGNWIPLAGLVSAGWLVSLMILPAWSSGHAVAPAPVEEHS
jgi:predicted MFS family arabinose efflux permease